MPERPPLRDILLLKLMEITTERVIRLVICSVALFFAFQTAYWYWLTPYQYHTYESCTTLVKTIPENGPSFFFGVLASGLVAVLTFVIPPIQRKGE